LGCSSSLTYLLLGAHFPFSTLSLAENSACSYWWRSAISLSTLKFLARTPNCYTIAAWKYDGEVLLKHAFGLVVDLAQCAFAVECDCATMSFHCVVVVAIVVAAFIVVWVELTLFAL
jgi:hypothetical protein